MRNRGDETARIIMAHAQEGIEPPSNLRRDFEEFLNMVCIFVLINNGIFLSILIVEQPFGGCGSYALVLYYYSDFHVDRRFI